MLCDGGVVVGYASTYAAPTKYAKCQKWKIVSTQSLSSKNYEWLAIFGAHPKLYHVDIGMSLNISKFQIKMMVGYNGDLIMLTNIYTEGQN